MIEWKKQGPNQWLVKRKEKSYPIKNLESLFVYSLAFGLKFPVIEETVIKMEADQLNYARFFRGQVTLERK